MRFFASLRYALNDNCFCFPEGLVGGFAANQALRPNQNKNMSFRAKRRIFKFNSVTNEKNLLAGQIPKRKT